MWRNTSKGFYVGLILYSILFPTRLAASPADENGAKVKNHQQSEAKASPGRSNCSIQTAESFFDSGNFSSADQLAENCLIQQPLPAQNELAKIYMLKARLAFAFKKEKEMESWLRKAAEADPSAKMSQLRDPPQLFAMWTRVASEAKTLQETQREKSAEKSTPQASDHSLASSSPRNDDTTGGKKSATAPDATPQSPAYERSKFQESFISVESSIKSKVRFGMGLLPLGIGHIAHNQIWEGSTFLVSESALLLLTSGLAESTRQRIRDSSSSYSFSQSISIPSQSSSSISFETESRWSDQATAYSLLGLTGFGALWGFEVLHLLPTLARENPEQEPWVRLVLSIAPMGVAQLKNGQRSKALGLAGTQCLFLLLSGALPNSGQREVSLLMFSGSLVFGAVDGWINHEWSSNHASRPPWSFGIAPQPRGNEGNQPFLLTFKYAIQE
ncbi:hypothetical protein EBR21_00120 [bacterium]|nr:hypothetical protein [bacterium]